MAKAYRIKVILDTAGVDAGRQRAQNAMQQMAAAGGRAAAQLDSVIDRLLLKDYNRRVSHEARKERAAAAAAAAEQARVAAQGAALERLENQYAAKDYSRRTAYERRKQETAEREAAAAQRREQSRLDALERLQDQYVAKDFARRTAFERRKQEAAEREANRQQRANRKLLTDEEVTQRARNRVIDQANRKRVDLAAGAMGYEKQSWADAVLGATRFGAAATAAGGALLAMDAGRQVLSSIVGVFQSAKQAGEQMARETFEVLSSLREIAAIKQKHAPDMAELAAHLNVRRASGLTHSQAVTYQTELYNVLGTVPEARFDATQRRELEVQGAQMAARVGRTDQDASVIASVLGLLPNFIAPGAGGKVEAKQVLGTGQAVYNILGRGAGSQQNALTQYRKVITALGSPDEEAVGYLKDARQAAGLVALGTAVNPEEASDIVLQATRAARRFTAIRKNRAQVGTQADTLRAAGITEKDDPQQALEKLFTHADRAFKGENLEQALSKRGFNDVTANRRLAQLHGLWQKGAWKDVMGMTQGPIDMGANERANAAFRESEVGLQLLADAAKDAARVLTGIADLPVNVAKAHGEAAAAPVDVAPLGQARRVVLGALGGQGLGAEAGRAIEVEEGGVLHQMAARPQGFAALSPAQQMQAALVSSPLKIPLLGDLISVLGSLVGSNQNLIRAMDKGPPVPPAAAPRAGNAAPAIPAPVPRRAPPVGVPMRP